MLDRDRITEYFLEQFSSGQSYASISSARKAIALKYEQMVTPGTLEAKIFDEAIELALVQISINLVQTSNPLTNFNCETDLYLRQPTLGVRSSTSARQQAYSTALSIAYLES